MKTACRSSCGGPRKFVLPTLSSLRVREFGDEGGEEVRGGGAGGGELRFQLVHQGHQLIHFGHGQYPKAYCCHDAGSNRFGTFLSKYWAATRSGVSNASLSDASVDALRQSRRTPSVAEINFNGLAEGCPRRAS